MPRELWLLSSFSIACSACFVPQAAAQDYPNKPIRIITAPAGGGSDFVARLIGGAISGPLGQQIVIDNRPTVQAAEALIKSPADGYHLQVGGNSIWISPLLQKVPYDIVRDYAPVSLLVREVLVLAVHPSLPVKSVKDLVDLAKARPNDLNYSSGALGGPGHLSAELLKYMTKVNITGIAYKGNGIAVTSVLSGETQMTIADAGLVMPHLKTGRLRALGVASAQPSPLAPGLPAIAATGIPGYEFVGLTAMLAPAKTPAGVVSRVNQEVVRAVNRNDIKEKLLASGVEAVGSSAEEAAATIRSDMAKLGKLIKDAGIKVE